MNVVKDATIKDESGISAASGLKIPRVPDMLEYFGWIPMTTVGAKYTAIKLNIQTLFNSFFESSCIGGETREVSPSHRKRLQVVQIF